jgi:FlaA1/EpsC-like NDP-sugar epimerase
MWTFIYKYRHALIVTLHVALICLANYLAFWLRFDGAIPEEDSRLLWQMFPWLLVIRGLIFIPFRLYGGMWRYTSIWDLRNIIGGVACSSVAFYVLVRWGFGVAAYPQSVYLIDALLLVFMLGGLRLSRRIYREFGGSDRPIKRVLIYGAGDAGEMIVRDMRYRGQSEYRPIGFIDDDPIKSGHQIHGVKVLGTREVLPRAMARLKPDTVLVAIPRAEPSTIRRIVKVLEPFKVPIQTLPNLRSLIDGTVGVSKIRNLSIEDLLERALVDLNAESLRHLIGGKRVLVTGAGGSIGSELCRQIASLSPAALVLCDRYENGLFAVTNELASRPNPVQTHAVIGDVTDRSRVARIMQEYQPQIVLHAAAHKHVPLMEASPCEAVKNNVGGTRVLAEIAQECHVERFIFISSDKAVNPSGVMGASKRVAELVIRHLSPMGRTIFASVRFGNVLGSNGSVVHTFMDQIKAGGPVTVTHPDVRRYFMLIPEAVHLVLHAGELAKGGELFVLDMGEQIKVLGMARNLIRLSGFVPEEEISIKFIGLRPGEKLSEELVGADETAAASSIPKILQVRSDETPHSYDFPKQIEELEWVASLGDRDSVLKRLSELVPSYQPHSISAEPVRNDRVRS